MPLKTGVTRHPEIIGDDRTLLLKLPVGFEYEVSSPTGKSTVKAETKSGYLVYVMQGFAVDGMDVYPVPRKGD